MLQKIDLVLNLASDQPVVYMVMRLNVIPICTPVGNVCIPSLYRCI